MVAARRRKLTVCAKKKSDPPRIIRPMQQRLPLPRPAVQVAGAAVFFDLRFVPAHRSPSFNLPLVVWAPATHKVSAVPLKPTSRIFLVNPTLLDPDRERLGSVHLIEIQLGIMANVRESGGLEPLGGKLVNAIGHVFATKDTKLKHLLWSQLRVEIRTKVFTGRLRQKIFVASLH